MSSVRKRVLVTGGAGFLGSHLCERLVARGDVSSLILNPTGHNEGVGRALNRAASISTGQWIVKLDQDLLFEPDWLPRIDLGWDQFYDPVGSVA